MSIEVITRGPGQNSYVTVEEANILLLSMDASFIDDDTPRQLVGDLDTARLLEAAQDLDTLWRWSGQVTDPAQELAWPRRFVTKPGFERDRDPLWANQWDYGAAISYKYDFQMPGGPNAVPYLPSDAVPRQVKQAQAMIALLRKVGGNLVGDDKGDDYGNQLDSGFKVAYVNAIRDASDIHKRLAGLGWFIGDPLLRVRHER